MSITRYDPTVDFGTPVMRKYTFGEFIKYDDHVNEVKQLEMRIVEECIKAVLETRDPSNLNYKPSETCADAIRFRFGLPTI